jgi:hypothetical protein
MCIAPGATRRFRPHHPNREAVDQSQRDCDPQSPGLASLRAISQQRNIVTVVRFSPGWTHTADPTLKGLRPTYRSAKPKNPLTLRFRPFRFIGPLPEAVCLLLLTKSSGNLPSPKQSPEQVERKSQPPDVFVGMKTDKMKFLGSAVLLALFTGACASVEDEGRASGAPPAVVIERERSTAPPPVIIEKDNDDKDVDVDLKVDDDDDD